MPTGKKAHNRKSSRKRYPNGRINYRSRATKNAIAKEEAAEAEAAKKAAIDARVRVFGLTEEQAQNRWGATAAGRLIFGDAGPASQKERQWDAVKQFWDLRDRYLTAIAAPKEGSGGGIRRGMPDLDDYEYQEWCGRQVKAWDDFQSFLRDVQNENREANLYAVLQYVIVEDRDMYHMLGDLRLLTNHMVRFFRVDGALEAA